MVGQTQASGQHTVSAAADGAREVEVSDVQTVAVQ